MKTIRVAIEDAQRGTDRVRIGDATFPFYAWSDGAIYFGSATVNGQSRLRIADFQSLQAVIERDVESDELEEALDKYYRNTIPGTEWRSLLEAIVKELKALKERVK